MRSPASQIFLHLEPFGSDQFLLYLKGTRCVLPTSFLPHSHIHSHQHSVFQHTENSLWILTIPLPIFHTSETKTDFFFLVDRIKNNKGIKPQSDSLKNLCKLDLVKFVKLKKKENVLCEL